MILMSLFSEAQTTCSYVEVNRVSYGYSCQQDALVFTSSIDTNLRGGISAMEEINVIPREGLSITILPTLPCKTCATDTGGGTTIGTKKGGNGGKVIDHHSQSKYQLIIRENPVDQNLIFYISEGILRKAIIYNVQGPQRTRQYTDERTRDELNVSKLPAGSYWLKVITADNQVYTKQFIKK